MATKSQLPMIRSLKAIARRKMNEWPDVPPAVAEQIKVGQLPPPPARRPASLEIEVRWPPKG